MTEITSLMLEHSESFASKLDHLIFEQKLHLTNHEALRCFLLGFLVNIFHSPVAKEHNLNHGLITTSPDCILFVTIYNDAQHSQKIESFLFNLTPNRKVVISLRTFENLAALLKENKIYENFLVEDGRKLETKIIKFEKSSNRYEVGTRT